MSTTVFCHRELCDISAQDIWAPIIRRMSWEHDPDYKKFKIAYLESKHLSQWKQVLSIHQRKKHRLCCVLGVLQHQWLIDNQQNHPQLSSIFYFIRKLYYLRLMRWLSPTIFDRHQHWCKLIIKNVPKLQYVPTGRLGVLIQNSFIWNSSFLTTMNPSPDWIATTSRCLGSFPLSSQRFQMLHPLQLESGSKVASPLVIEADNQLKFRIPQEDCFLAQTQMVKWGSSTIGNTHFT